MATTKATTKAPRYTVLNKVETIEVLPNSELIIRQDGSDSKSTLQTIDSKTIDIGNIAPGETSVTKIIYLNVPSSLGINNIKLGLIDTGGIEFRNDTFGIESLNYLDFRFEPKKYFQGVNLEKRSSNQYNYSIPNNGLLSSQYVYLNVKIPTDLDLGGRVVRYKWFFDYASGISSTDTNVVGSTGSP